jgi:hypothetical protein
VCELQNCSGRRGVETNLALQGIDFRPLGLSSQYPVVIPTALLRATFPLAVCVKDNCDYSP